MSLSVSVNGGDRVPATDVVIFDDGVPIAGAMQHGDMLIYADSVRDRRDFLEMLQELAVNIPPATPANIKLVGKRG